MKGKTELKKILLISSLFIIFGGLSHNLLKADAIKEPLGLPPIPWPQHNPYSKDKAELGRLLYFDERLSSDGTVSCASCHYFSSAYADAEPVSFGINHRQGSRNSPTIINTAYANFLFWDGRATSLEEQCAGPLANTKEMTDINTPHEAHKKCVEKISQIPGYLELFEKAFGDREISIEKITQAIATTERTVLSGNSPYDRYIQGDTSALSKKAVLGLQVFNDVGCAYCHSGFNFCEDGFQNIGIGMQHPNPDTGRYEITKQEKDWGAFKIPTLREIEHTAPYMHDGSLKTLEEVVDYYDKGGINNKNLHPLIRPLHLSEEEKEALVCFLKSLSGEGWQHFKRPEEFP